MYFSVLLFRTYFFLYHTTRYVNQCGQAALTSHIGKLKQIVSSHVRIRSHAQATRWPVTDQLLDMCDTRVR